MNFRTPAYRTLATFGVTAAMLASLSQSALARPSYASDSEEIHGRISSVPDKYHLLVRDERGYSDNVSLHQGTVINPIGLTLSQGMRVTIYGHGDNDTFDADEIDTPYRHVATAYPYPAAYPIYPVYPYAYGYPYYGGGYGYGGGYSSTTVIVNGGGGGWHGGPHDGGHWRR